MMKKKIILMLVLIFIMLVIIYNYSSSNGFTNKTLHPITTIALHVPEPSGLHYEKSSNSLWTVSDENSTIYNISLEGKILSTLTVDGFDLEGITIIKDSILVTILERDRSVVFLNKLGKEKSKYSLSLEGKPNKGLEGIAYNPNKSILYVLNEKNPGMLITIDSTGSITSKNILDFASDFSGLCYNDIKDELWIISDENEAIFKCSSNGSLLAKYSVNIEQIEGIAIDFEDSKLYVISDPLEKLYIYELP